MISKISLFIDFYRRRWFLLTTGNVVNKYIQVRNINQSPYRMEDYYIKTSIQFYVTLREGSDRAQIRIYG